MLLISGVYGTVVRVFSLSATRPRLWCQNGASTHAGSVGVIQWDSMVQKPPVPVGLRDA
jgi:hypothetical protein